MILVTGATGQYGTKVLEYLLKKGIGAQHLSALVRDAAKGQPLQDQGIELRVGDYADVDALVQAFQGVATLLLVSSNDRGAVENRTAHHLNVIKAAKVAQVKHLVYTSFVTKPAFQHSAIADFLTSHAHTEQAIKDSGLPYTILQHGIYLEMIPIPGSRDGRSALSRSGWESQLGAASRTGRSRGPRPDYGGARK
jgi:NAD(P)H dehydrogenase (quinone)